MSGVLEATKETFPDLVGSGVVLVDLGADSCRPCVALAPHMAQIARTHPELTVVKLDASKARRLCMSLRVRGLPTLLLFHQGQEVARLSVPQLSSQQVDTWLAEALSGLRPEATKEA